MAARLWSPLLIALFIAGPAVGQERADDLGDPLPAGALYRIGTTRLQLGESVQAVALAPDGKLVAAVGTASFALWETASGRELFRVSSRRGSLRPGIAWAPDGQSFVVNHEWHLCRFDVPSRKIRQWLGGDTLCAAFARDGRTLTVVQGDQRQRVPTVRRWDLAAGKSVAQWQYPAPPKARTTDIHFEPWLSPDGEQLAMVRIEPDTKVQMVRIYDAGTGIERRHWPLRDPPAWHPALSPDGKLLAISSLDSTIRVLDAATGKERFRRTPDQNPDLRKAGWYDIHFAPDSASLLCRGQGSLIRWDCATGKEIQRYPDVWGPAAFSADGKIIAVAGPHSGIRVFDAATGKDLCPLPRPVPQVVFSPDARSLAWTDRGAIVVADARTGKVQHCWPAQTLHDSPIAIAPDGKTVAVLGRDKHIHLWSLPEGRATRAIAVRLPVERLFFTADGRCIVSRGPSWDCAWDTATGARREPWAENESGLIAAEGHAALGYVKSPDGGFLQVIDPATGKVRHRAPDYPGLMYSVLQLPRMRGLITCNFVPQFSPDRRLLLVTDRLTDAPKSGAVFVWDLAAGKRLPLVLHGTELILDNRYLAFSPNGRLLAHVRSDGGMALLSLATGDVIRKLGTMHDALSAPPIFAFTPDGRTVVSGERGLVQFWEVATGGEIARRIAHPQGINGLVVSPDGCTLATTGDKQPSSSGTWSI